MIRSFIVAKGFAVYSSEYFFDYCGCFGGDRTILLKTSDALFIDIAMIVMASVILLCGGGRWSLDVPIRAKLKRPTPQGRLIADEPSGGDAGGEE